MSVPSKSTWRDSNVVAVQRQVAAVAHVMKQRSKPLAAVEPLLHQTVGLQGSQQFNLRAAATMLDEIVPNEVIHAAGNPSRWRANSTTRWGLPPHFS